MTMTDTEAKALALVNEVFMERCLVPDTYTNRAGNPYHEALCRAIERLEATEASHAAELRELKERFDAFRQEVSDAVEDVRDNTTYDVHPKLWRFIIPKPKPDPLVEAIKACEYATLDAIEPEFAESLRAAIEARGGRIVWGDDQ